MSQDYTAYDRLIEGVQIIGPDMRYIYVNRPVCEHARLDADALVGFRMTEVFPGIEATDVYRTIEACMSDRQPREYVNEFLFDSGERGYFLLRMQALDEGVLILSYDITQSVRAEKRLQEQNLVLEQQNRELKELNERLRLLSVTDELTGLFNRRHFMRCSREEFSRYKRHGSVYCIAILDLDDFKIINDTYGHDVGDDVLVTIAQHLRRHAREHDILARYGGEEFTLLMPSTGSDQAEHFIQRVQRELGADVGQTGFSPTFSAGVCQVSAAMHSASEVISLADKALYAAKNAGKNCVRVASTKRRVG